MDILSTFISTLSAMASFKSAYISRSRRSRLLQEASTSCGCGAKGSKCPPRAHLGC